VREEPPPSVLEWVHRRVRAQVHVLRGLRQAGSPWLVRLSGATGARTAVLKIAASEVADAVRTEAAALTAAAAGRLPVPRLLAADPDGADAGVPVLLQSVVAGRSTIPPVASGDRLRAAGAALAAVHAVRPGPGHALPVRERPIPASDFVAARRAGAASTPLLDAAEVGMREGRARVDDPVLVHGDIWHGNLLWTGDRVSGIVDWDMAGVGHPGVDVGALRLDAALLYGIEAAGPVLDGWRAVGAGPADGSQPYWDVVAAANTPTDLAGFLPVIQDQGRPDLDAAVLTARRDDFLRRALDLLG
jgi:aminoglycoside phosphotransferase (APT) family kinase protein